MAAVVAASLYNAYAGAPASVCVVPMVHNGLAKPRLEQCELCRSDISSRFTVYYVYLFSWYIADCMQATPMNRVCDTPKLTESFETVLFRPKQNVPAVAVTVSFRCADSLKRSDSTAGPRNECG